MSFLRKKKQKPLNDAEYQKSISTLIFTFPSIYMNETKNNAQRTILQGV